MPFFQKHRVIVRRWRLQEIDCRRLRQNEPVDGAGVTSGSEIYSGSEGITGGAKCTGAISAGAAGVDVAKLTSAMEKSEITAGKNVLANAQLDKTEGGLGTGNL